MFDGLTTEAVALVLARYCDNCGRPLEAPPDAPHKRFCSAKCRNEWHYQRAKARRQQTPAGEGAGAKDS